MAAIEVPPHFMQQQMPSPVSSAAVVQPMSSGKNNTKSAKSSKSRSPKPAPETKMITPLQKTDLLAQATATAGILMDGGDFVVTQAGESLSGLQTTGPADLNNSGSSSTGELQISLKQSPREEEDDNIQLIIDENCSGASGGTSSASPARSAFSPNMNSLSVHTPQYGLTHSLSGPQSGLVGSQSNADKFSGDLTTPLVSPIITSSLAQQRQRQKTQQMSSSPNLSSVGGSLYSKAVPSSTTQTSNNTMMVSGSFRAEDVFAQLSNSLGAERKTDLPSSAMTNKLTPLNIITSPNSSAAFSMVNSSNSNPMNINSVSPIASVNCNISPKGKGYVPIAPAPNKIAVSSSVGPDMPTFTLSDSMGHSSLLQEKNKGKNRGNKKLSGPNIASVAPVVSALTVSICDSAASLTSNMVTTSPVVVSAVSVETKKKPPAKKRKTKAELRREKEEREKQQKEGEEKKKREEDKRAIERQVFGNNNQAPQEEDGLMTVLEVNENDAVKEQILNSVAESKLLNTDGSFISLMDVVDNMDILSSEHGEDNSVFGNSSKSNSLLSGNQQHSQSNIVTSQMVSGNTHTIKSNDMSSNAQMVNARSTSQFTHTRNPFPTSVMSSNPSAN